MQLLEPRATPAANPPPRTKSVQFKFYLVISSVTFAYNRLAPHHLVSPTPPPAMADRRPLEFWQRPFAYGGEEVEGRVVGTEYRGHQTSIAARDSRRELRSSWMEASMKVALESGKAGLTWKQFKVGPCETIP